MGISALSNRKEVVMKFVLVVVSCLVLLSACSGSPAPEPRVNLHPTGDRCTNNSQCGSSEVCFTYNETPGLVYGERGPNPWRGGYCGRL